MAKVLHQAAEHGTTLSTSTRWSLLGGSPGISLAGAPEAGRQTLYRAAGILSNLYVTVTSNDRTTDGTIRVRKNTANGSQVLTITALTTGEFTDAINTDVVAVGDLINFESNGGGGGTQCLVTIMRCIFSPSVNTVTVYNRTVGSMSDATFLPICGNTGNPAIELNNQMETGSIGTMQNGHLRIATNTRDGDTTFRFRKNGANANIVVTIPAAGTGFFEDLVNTDITAAGDLWNWNILFAGTTGAITGNASKVEWLTTNRGFMLACNGSQTVTTSLTRYFTTTGSIIPIATESEVQGDIGIKGTQSRLRAYIGTNTITASSTLRLRKNAANANQVVTIAASTTGEFQDLVNTDSVVETDSINYSLVTGATGTNIGIRTFDMFMITSAGRVKDVIGINTVPWARP